VLGIQNPAIRGCYFTERPPSPESTHFLVLPDGLAYQVLDCFRCAVIVSQQIAAISIGYVEKVIDPLGKGVVPVRPRLLVCGGYLAHPRK
jgi:hypothetical protein